jgi:AraC-like DNA-binding protein
MDKTGTGASAVYRETRFRQPNRFERDLGVWVDRIGAAGTGGPWPRLRLLGQFAAVAIEEGCGRVEAQGIGTADAGAGDVILVWPDVPTRYNCHGGSWTTKWVVWNGTEADFWRRTLRWPPLVVRQAGVHAIAAHRRLSDLMAGEDAVSAFRRKVVLMSMVGELAGGIEDGGVSVGPAQRVRATMDAMVEACGRDWDLEGLAKAAGLSHSQYRRVFRECAGSSPMGFLRSVRIAKAKGLLLQGIPIKDVAARTGFSDVFYFMRAFREVAGVPPGRFARLGGWAGGA